MRLVDINHIKPSTYNPRRADPRRLDLMELSLRKLGFVMPLYADQSGELLSGHQRHYIAAERMNLAKVPVEYVRKMSLEDRKAMNIVFNRATNDLKSGDIPQDLTRALEEHDPFTLARELPDCPPDKFYRCMTPVQVDTRTMIKANIGWNRYARNVSGTLARKGIEMALVCTSDLKVINGIGRLQLYSEMKKKTVPVVFITDQEAKFTNVMLNYLSMDFDIHTRYADILRYNSFRRPRGKRSYLGRAFTFPILRNQTSANFDIKNPTSLATWKSIFGRNVIDFGAGLLDETNLLRSVGINCVPFEPFYLDGAGEISRSMARGLTMEFLNEIAKGYEFDSIFLSAVLNSVPFLDDRRHIIYILNSLATENTKVYAVSSSVKQAGYQIVTGKEFANKSDGDRIQFLLGYEPRTTLGDFARLPKVQKYHTTQEWHDLWNERFAQVIVSESSNNVECICSKPRPIDLARLDKALEFEFSLPYPDGGRMDLVENAKQAFRARVEKLSVKYSKNLV